MKTAVDRFIFSFTQFDATSRLEAVEKLLRQLDETELDKVLHSLNYENLNAVTRLQVLKHLTRAFDRDQIEKALSIIDLKLHEPEVNNHMNKNILDVRTKAESDGNGVTDSEGEIRRDPAVLAVIRGVRKHETNLRESKGRGRGIMLGKYEQRRRKCATSDSDSESWDTVTSGAEEVKQKSGKKERSMEGRATRSQIPPITRRLREEIRVIQNTEPKLTNPRTVHSDGKITITRHAEPRTILEENGKIKVTRQMMNNEKDLSEIDMQQTKSRSVFEENGKITVTRQIRQDEKTSSECSELEQPYSSLSPQASEFTASKSSPILRNDHETNKPGINQLLQSEFYALKHARPTQAPSNKHPTLRPGTHWRHMVPQIKNMHYQMLSSNVPHSSQPILYHLASSIQADQYPATNGQFHVTREQSIQVLRVPKYQTPSDQYQAATGLYPESEEHYQINSNQYQPTVGYYNPYLCGLLNTHKQLAS